MAGAAIRRCASVPRISSASGSTPGKGSPSGRRGCPPGRRGLTDLG